VAANDIIKVAVDPRDPGIEWNFVPKMMTQKHDIIVHGVLDGMQIPKKGWRLLEIKSKNCQVAPNSKDDLIFAIEKSVKGGNEKIEFIFDSANEDAVEETSLDSFAHNAAREAQIDIRDLPCFPVVEPSVYLHIMSGSGFRLGGRAPHASFLCPQITDQQSTYVLLIGASVLVWKRSGAYRYGVPRHARSATMATRKGNLSVASSSSGEP